MQEEVSDQQVGMIPNAVQRGLLQAPRPVEPEVNLFCSAHVELVRVRHDLPDDGFVEVVQIRLSGEVATRPYARAGKSAHHMYFLI